MRHCHCLQLLLAPCSTALAPYYASFLAPEAAQQQQSSAQRPLEGHGLPRHCMATRGWGGGKPGHSSEGSPRPSTCPRPRARQAQRPRRAARRAACSSGDTGTAQSATAPPRPLVTAETSCPPRRRKRRPGDCGHILRRRREAATRLPRQDTRPWLQDTRLPTPRRTRCGTGGAGRREDGGPPC